MVCADSKCNEQATKTIAISYKHNTMDILHMCQLHTVGFITGRMVEDDPYVASYLIHDCEV